LFLDKKMNNREEKSRRYEGTIHNNEGYQGSAREHRIKEKLWKAKNFEKKKQFYNAADNYVEAARLAAENDPRNAAKYATMAEKNYDKYGLSRSDIHGSEKIYSAKDARKLAQALRHEAAKRKVRGIESHVTAAVFLIIGAAGIFFLSPNLTGNVIGNNSINNSNLIGAILFFIGLIGLLFTFKRNK